MGRYNPEKHYREFLVYLIGVLKEKGFKKTGYKKRCYTKYSRFGIDLYFPIFFVGKVVIFFGERNQILYAYNDNIQKSRIILYINFLRQLKIYELNRMLETDDATKTYFQEERDSY